MDLPAIPLIATLIEKDEACQALSQKRKANTPVGTPSATASGTYLQQRPNGLYFRLRLTNEQAAIIGKREILKKLPAMQIRKARLLCQSLAFRIKQVMESPNREQWLDEIRALIIEHGLTNKDCLAQMRVIRDEVLTDPPNQKTVERLAQGVPSAELNDKQCIEDLAYGHLYKLFLQAQRAHPEAYEALKAVKPETIAFYQGDDAGRFQGEQPRFYEFRDTKPFEPFRGCASSPVSPTVVEAPKRLLSALIGEFYDFEQRKAGGFKRKTQEDWDNWLKVTKAILTEVTRDSVLAYRDHVESIPRNWSKLNKYKGMTLLQVLATDIPEDAKIMRQTIEKHFWRTVKLLEWLHLEGHADKNYSSLVEMTKKAERRVNDPRKPFTDDDIAQLLNGLEGDQRLIVLMLAYTGARSGEIAALTPSDIIEHQGVKCFDINKGSGDDGALKNESSKRLVPIHSQLLPELENFKGFKGMNSDLIGNWLNPRIKKLKDSKDKVTHGFRHTVATRLNEAGVDEADISKILGHSKGGVTARYTHGFNMQRLKEAIEKLTISTGGP